MKPMIVVSMLAGPMFAGYAAIDPLDDSIPPEAPIAVGARYFQTPENAIDTVNRLVEAQDWIHLASYCECSDGGVTPTRLENGALFDAPGPETPAYVLPAEYVHHEDRADADAIDVYVRGNEELQRLSLRRSADGYRLIKFRR